MRRKKNFFLLIALVCYIQVSADVQIEWVRIYNGPGNSVDRTTSIAVDQGGSIYVTGYSWDSITSYDYATIKYATNGDTVWVRRYNGPGNDWDMPTDLEVDGDGNVYVTGTSRGNGTQYDYATIKYTPNGDTLWVRRYNGPLNFFDQANALAVDSSGNVHVTGQSDGESFGEEYATIKYASSGETLWVRRYNGGPGSSTDQAYTLAVDKGGKVYVTGLSWGGASYDYATIKYTPNGDTLWVRRYNGPVNSSDFVNALAVDAGGNVYVTAQSANTNLLDDYATIKYAPNGDTLWVRRYNGSKNGSDRPKALGVDGLGNVYVTGYSEELGTSNDYTSIKYNPNGDAQWVRHYNKQGNGHDFARALAVDGNGNVYVAGGSGTIKYSANGDSLWFGSYGGWQIVLDSFENVYVIGGNGNDYLTVKYKQCEGWPGDADGDGNLTFLDIVYQVNYVFKKGPTPVPFCSGDDDGDGQVNLKDIVYKINHIIKDGPAPTESGLCCLD